MNDNLTTAQQVYMETYASMLRVQNALLELAKVEFPPGTEVLFKYKGKEERGVTEGMPHFWDMTNQVMFRVRMSTGREHRVPMNGGILAKIPPQTSECRD